MKIECNLLTITDIRSHTSLVNKKTRNPSREEYFTVYVRPIQRIISFVLSNE